MITILQVQKVLADRPGEKLRTFQIARALNITTNDFNKRVDQWLRHGHLSRESGKGKWYVYYLSEQQVQVYRLKTSLVAVRAGGEQPIGLEVDARDLPARLNFLRMLKEKTVFSDHALLGLIIGDYERTLSLRRKHADAN
jgi:hypothetical protein